MGRTDRKDPDRESNRGAWKGGRTWRRGVGREWVCAGEEGAGRGI